MGGENKQRALERAREMIDMEIAFADEDWSPICPNTEGIFIARRSTNEQHEYAYELI